MNENYTGDLSSIGSLQEKIRLYAEIKKLDGDYNDSIKEGIKALKEAQKALEKQVATNRLLYEGELNVRKVEKEIYKSQVEREIVASRIEVLQKRSGDRLNADIKEVLKGENKVKELEKELSRTREESNDKIIQLQENLTSLENQRAAATTKADEQIFTKKIQQQQRLIQQENESFARIAKSQSILIESQKEKTADKIKDLNTDQLELLALQSKEEALTRAEELRKRELNYQKEVKSIMGTSGELAFAFAKKLGLGTEVYEAMVRKAVQVRAKNDEIYEKMGDKRAKAAAAEATNNQDIIKQAQERAKVELDQQGKKVMWRGKETKAYQAEVEKQKKILVDQAAESARSTSTFWQRGVIAPFKMGFDSFKPLFSGLKAGATQLVAPFLTFPGALLGVGGLLVVGVKKLLDLMLAVNEQNVKFQKLTGQSADNVKTIRAEYERFSNNTVNVNAVLLTSRKYMEAQAELAEQLGIAGNKEGMIRADILENLITGLKVMGLSADSQAEIVTASYITGQNQDKLVKSIIGQIERTREVTGVTLNYKRVIEEASKLGGVLGLQFAKYPAELAKSLTIVKALGQDMKALEQQATGLVDFESSITAEMEAQLLTGRNINLSKARQLALDNDLSGLAIELNSQLGDAGSFLQMNRIQQEGFAKAIGLSRDTLADILKKRELNLKLGLGENATAGQQLEKARQLYKTQEGINAALGESAYQNLTSLSIQERISALIDKVKATFEEFISKSGLVDVLSKLISDLTSPAGLRSLVGTISSIADKVVGAAFMLGELAAKIGKLLPGSDKAFDDALAGIEKARIDYERFKLRAQESAEAGISRLEAKGEEATPVVSNEKASIARLEQLVGRFAESAEKISKSGNMTVNFNGQFQVDGNTLATTYHQKVISTPFKEVTTGGQFLPAYTPKL